MLTGKRAFAGDDVGDTLAAVLRGEPEWRTLPVETPAAIRRLLRRCLEKDRKRRLESAADAGLEIEDALTAPESDSPTTAPGSRGWRLGAMIAAAALVAGVAAGGAVWIATRPAPPSVVRTTITTSGSTALALSAGDRDLVITPDGSRIIYRNNNQLMVRALDQLEPTVLSRGFTGTGPRGVFISPDGQWVGFFDRNFVLKKVAMTGGAPVTVQNQRGSASRGATWSKDGTIIFATLTQETGLQRVSSAGGEPAVLTKPDRERGEGDHFWPEFLPGGKAVLFTITPANGSIETAQVAALDLQTGTSKILIRGGSHAHYVPTGHLIYGVTGTLHAVAFDLGRLEVVGTPVPVLEDVVTTDQGAADVALAANGSLVYVPGGAGDRQTVVLVDRQGRSSPLPGLPPASYRDVRVSPDGTRIAVGTDTDVSTYDVVRGTLSRLTINPALIASRTAARSGRPMGSGSSSRRPVQVILNCIGGRRTAPAATSRSSHEGTTPWTCAPWGGRPTANSCCLRSSSRAVRARSGRYRINQPSDAKMLVQGSERPRRLSKRALDRLRVGRVGSTGDLRRAVSGTRKSAADLDGWRPYPRLVA